MFGNPETTTGGNALKFYSSVRIDVRRVTSIKDGENIIGNKTKVKIVKSKVSIPFKTVELDIINPYGFDIIGDVLDCAVEFGVIKKGGAWFTYGEERFQGRDRFREFLKSDPIFLVKLREETMAAMKTNRVIPKQQEALPPL